MRTTLALQRVTIFQEGGTTQTLQTTPEHPFYVEGRGWIEAKDLRPGDLLLSPEGGHEAVAASEPELHPEGVRVYNFEVAGARTYFVDADAVVQGGVVWVHNTCITINGPVGRARQQRAVAELVARCGAGNVQTERYLRDASSEMLRGLDGTGRRIDAVVLKVGTAMRRVEITSMNATKHAQQAKEAAIRSSGPVFVRDWMTRKLVDVANVLTEVMRRE